MRRSIVLNRSNTSSILGFDPKQIKELENKDEIKEISSESSIGDITPRTIGELSPTKTPTLKAIHSQ